MPLPLEKDSYSFADYLTWPENERWEIIDGIAMMQVTPSPRHQDVLNSINVQFCVYLTGKPCKVYPAPFCVRLPKAGAETDDKIDQVIEPDISVICRKEIIDDKGCNGSPDLIVEVISPTSGRHDRFTKFRLYEQAGVKEYWIVEPQSKLVSVFTLQDNKRYGRPEIFTEEDRIKVSLFPDLYIDLRTVFE